jgi:FAD:protein FMN transferase
MKHMKIFVGLVVIVALIAIFALFRPERMESTFFAMGSIPCKVVTYGRDMLEFDADLSAVEELVSHMEETFNAHHGDSELSRMNRDAYPGPFKASVNMLDVIGESRKWVTKSSGAFDPSVGPLISLWKHAGKTDKLPSAAEINQARSRVGFNDLVEVSAGGVSYKEKGVSVNFGAVAKGAIVDAAVRLLKSRGVERGLVEAGGDAFAFGNELFKFGIQDPTDKAKIMGTLSVGQGAVVTSGNYERYSEIDGKRYSHIIDPRTGSPVGNEIVSVTVVGGSAASADAMATALMVLGLEEGIALVKKVDGMDAVFVKQASNGFEVWVSVAVKSRLVLKGVWAENIQTY